MIHRLDITEKTATLKVTMMLLLIYTYTRRHANEKNSAQQYKQMIIGTMIINTMNNEHTQTHTANDYQKEGNSKSDNRKLYKHPDPQ